MIEELYIIGLVPARGGSKRLPGKNIKPLAGKPLLEWTIQAGRASRYIDRLILSSDDPDIVAQATASGCEVPFIRPAELAQDQTSSAEVVLHALDMIGHDPDLLVLLQPTSPLRTATDIDQAIELCVTHDAPSCITVVRKDEATHTHLPVYCLGANYRLEPSAGAPKMDEVVPNGAVYVVRVSEFRRSPAFVTAGTLGLLMPAGRSADIDTEADMQLAERLITQSQA